MGARLPLSFLFDLLRSRDTTAVSCVPQLRLGVLDVLLVMEEPCFLLCPPFASLEAVRSLFETENK